MDQEEKDRLITALEEKMFAKWPDFDHTKEGAQEKWEKLRWTRAEYDVYRDWAIAYLRKETSFSEYQCVKEVTWFMLDYAPIFAEDAAEKEFWSEKPNDCEKCRFWKVSMIRCQNCTMSNRSLFEEAKE